VTVLILAGESDGQADLVVRALGERDVPVFRVDTARFPAQLDNDVELGGTGWVGRLVTPRHTVELEHVRSVWTRSPSAFRFPDALSPTERRWVAAESKYGLGGVLACLPALYVNHPNRQADAAYKPVQLVTAQRVGLRVAPTLVTNTETAVRRFAAQASGSIVTKSFASPTITEEGHRKVAFTRLMSQSDLDDLAGVSLAAHQFQHWIAKSVDARSIVIGGKVFSFAIHAATADSYVDFRRDYGALTYEAISTPPDVEHAILAFNRTLGLAYGAFDFVIDLDGRWWFLECNAGGQYGWLESHTGIALTDALADLLARGLSGPELPHQGTVE
jgi:ATP-grasp ribosomal peptide maturase